MITWVRRARAGGDDGNALVLTMTMLALVTALTLTLALVSTGNLASARRMQQAGVAVNAADAGVAQAVSYLRSDGVKDLSCSPTCASNPWGNKNAPMTVTLDASTGQQFRAWIEPIAPYPAHKPGLYRIHASGSAAGDAARSVTTEATVSPMKVPLGIFAETINGGGNAGVYHQSIFSTGCVYSRSKIKFTGVDLAYGGIPSGVRTSQTITDSQGSGHTCPGTKKPIHGAACNPTYPNDMDQNGGPLGGTPCAGAVGQYDPVFPFVNAQGQFPYTSKISSDEELLDMFGLKVPALAASEMDRLRTIALAQGNYHTSATGWATPDEANAVMFFDLAATNPGGLVDLKDLAGYDRAIGIGKDDSRCISESLIIVIDGGNVRLNGNKELSASIFLTSDAPYGQVMKANGTAQLVGTMYADTIDLTGTADLHMDECFLNTLPPALFDIETREYREIDR